MFQETVDAATLIHRGLTRAGIIKVQTFVRHGITGNQISAAHGTTTLTSACRGEITTAMATVGAGAGKTTLQVKITTQVL